MNKILIFGSAGQLGSDLVKILEQENEVIQVLHKDIQIEDGNAVKNLIINKKPNYVINATAFHNVQECEENISKSYLINCIALRPIIDACNELDATLIHFSTNYVFGLDNRSTPYYETDLAHPANIYGLSKLAGEKMIRTYSKKWYVFRVSGLFGLKGSSAKKYKNFAELIIDLGSKNNELPSNNQEKFTFTYTKTISRVILKILPMKKYGLYHLTSSGESTRMEFALEIFKQLDISCKLTGVSSSYFKPEFRQPDYTVLNCDKIEKLGINLPHWKTSLREYLGERALLNNEK